MGLDLSGARTKPGHRGLPVLSAVAHGGGFWDIRGREPFAGLVGLRGDCQSRDLTLLDRSSHTTKSQGPRDSEAKRPSWTLVPRHHPPPRGSRRPTVHALISHHALACFHS